MQYKVGTVTTNGTNQVTGSGTAWLTNAAIGDLFWIQGQNAPYYIGNVNSDTLITLTSVFAGPSLAGQNYVIARSFTASQKFPYPESTDIDTHTIVKRAMTMIDTILGAAVGAAGQANRVVFTDANGNLTTNAGLKSTGSDLTINGSAGTGKLNLKDGGYRAGINFERSGNAAQRAFMYVGDGTNSTVSDEVYWDMANTALHLRAGASGTTNILTIGDPSGAAGAIRMGSAGTIAVGVAPSASQLVKVDSTAANITGFYASMRGTTGSNYGGDFEATGSGATANIGVYAVAANATSNFAIQIPSGFPPAGANNYAIKSESAAQSLFSGQVNISGGANNGTPTATTLTIGGGGGSPNAASFTWGDGTGWVMRFGTGTGGFTPTFSFIDTGKFLASKKIQIGNQAESATGYVLESIGTGAGKFGALLKNDDQPSAACDLWNASTTGNAVLAGLYTDAAVARGSITYNRGGGVVAYNTTSGAELKDIHPDDPMAKSLEVLRATRMRVYSWKADPTGKKHVGPIADEMMRVMTGSVTVTEERAEYDGRLFVRKIPPQKFFDRASFNNHLVVGWQNHDARLAEIERRLGIS